MHSSLISAALAALVIGSAGAPSLAALIPAAPVSLTPPATPPLPVPKGTAVELPFDPPIGEELRYIRTQEEQGANGKKSNAIEVRVRFDRSGSGFRMWTKVEVPGAPAALLAQPLIQVMLRPLVLQVSTDGEITGIEDEAGYWRSLDSITGSVSQAIAPDPEGRKFLLELFASMRRLPDAERLALISRNVAPIVAFAATAAEVGASRSGGMEEVSLPFPGAPKILREQKLTLASATADTADFELTSSFDEAAFERALEELMTRFPQKEGRPSMSELPAVGQLIRASVSRQSGLVRSYVEKIYAEPGASGGEPEIKTISMHLIR